MYGVDIRKGGSAKLKLDAGKYLMQANKSSTYCSTDFDYLKCWF